MNDPSSFRQQVTNPIVVWLGLILGGVGGFVAYAYLLDWGWLPGGLLFAGLLLIPVGALVGQWAAVRLLR